MKRFLVFDLEANFGQFRRGYTTTSPKTYPFPTGTVISGIIGAIIGLDYKSYYGYLPKFFSRRYSEYSVRILNPIRYITISENYIETKNYPFTTMLSVALGIKSIKQPPRAQVPLDFIYHPRYRLYVHLSPEFKINSREALDILIERVENGSPFYIPYLGITECIASIKFIDVYEGVEENFDEAGISSVALVNKVDRLVMEPGKVYSRIRVPREMGMDRKTLGFVDLYYEPNGNTIKGKNVLGYRYGEDVFITF